MTFAIWSVRGIQSVKGSSARHSYQFRSIVAAGYIHSRRNSAGSVVSVQYAKIRRASTGLPDEFVVRIPSTLLFNAIWSETTIRSHRKNPNDFKRLTTHHSTVCSSPTCHTSPCLGMRTGGFGSYDGYDPPHDTTNNSTTVKSPHAIPIALTVSCPSRDHVRSSFMVRTSVD